MYVDDQSHRESLAALMDRWARRRRSEIWDKSLVVKNLQILKFDVDHEMKLKILVTESYVTKIRSDSWIQRKILNKAVKKFIVKSFLSLSWFRFRHGNRSSLQFYIFSATDGCSGVQQSRYMSLSAYFSQRKSDNTKSFLQKRKLVRCEK